MKSFWAPPKLVSTKTLLLKHYYRRQGFQKIEDILFIGFGCLAECPHGRWLSCDRFSDVVFTCKALSRLQKMLFSQQDAAITVQASTVWLEIFTLQQFFFLAFPGEKRHININSRARKPWSANRELRGWQKRGCREGCRERPEKGA